jgi:hypothetical protein
MVESPSCTFCLSHIEDQEHFFVNCIYSRNLYIDIKNWLKKVNLKLPELSLENFILGKSENIMEDFLFLLY